MWSSTVKINRNFMNIRESITLPTLLRKETLVNPIHFDSNQWRKLKWEKIKARVSKLMLRIAEATTRGARHLIKRLQYLLRNSFYAKLLAVKKVTENKGKKTSGIDKVRWLTAQSKLKGALSLNCKGYKFRRAQHIKKKI